MKKFLPAIALVLSVVMMFSLASCSFTQGDKKGEINNNGDVTQNGNEPDSNKPNPEKPNPEKPDPEKPNPEKPDPEKPDPEKPDPEKPVEPEKVVFEDRNETVFVLASSLNVRKDTNFESAILGHVSLAQGVKRIGYHKTYSKILFDDDNDPKTKPVEAYVATKYVTADDVSDKDFTVLDKPEDAFVSASAFLNVRMLPHAEASLITTLKRGEMVKRISYGKNWTKIAFTYVDPTTKKEVNGIGYVNSKYVSAKDPDEKVEPKEFSKDKFSIKLTTEFKEAVYDKFTAAYETEKILTLVIKETFEDLKKAQIESSISVADYLKLVLKNNKITADVQSKNGLTYYVCDSENEGKEFRTLAFGYKGSDGFWLVQFCTLKNDFASCEVDILNFAKSVNVK